MNPDPNVKYDPREDKISNVMENSAGFIQVVHIIFNSENGTYEDLCKHMFTFHDATIDYNTVHL